MREHPFGKMVLVFPATRSCHIVTETEIGTLALLFQSSLAVVLQHRTLLAALCALCRQSILRESTFRIGEIGALASLVLVDNVGPPSTYTFACSTTLRHKYVKVLDDTAPEQRSALVQYEQL